MKKKGSTAVQKIKLYGNFKMGKELAEMLKDAMDYEGETNVSRYVSNVLRQHLLKSPGVFIKRLNLHHGNIFSKDGARESPQVATEGVHSGSSPQGESEQSNKEQERNGFNDQEARAETPISEQKDTGNQKDSRYIIEK